MSAANALPKNPDSVIATWIVDRNLEDWAVSAASFAARLSPSSTSFWSFMSLKEITAISALAKIAFNMISTT